MLGSQCSQTSTFLVRVSRWVFLQSRCQPTRNWTGIGNSYQSTKHYQMNNEDVHSLLTWADLEPTWWKGKHLWVIPTVYCQQWVLRKEQPPGAPPATEPHTTGQDFAEQIERLAAAARSFLVGNGSEQSEAHCGFGLHVPSAFISSKCSCMPGSQEYMYYATQFNVSGRKFSWVPHSSTQPNCSERLLHLIQRLPVPAVSHVEKGSCCLTTFLVAQVSRGEDSFFFPPKTLTQPMIWSCVPQPSSALGARNRVSQRSEMNTRIQGSI